jgi:hypothetical protein
MFREHACKCPAVRCRLRAQRARAPHKFIRVALT